jgi:hypothetical protein
MSKANTHLIIAVIAAGVAVHYYHTSMKPKKA